MTTAFEQARHPVTVAIPAVEFVDLADRLPHLHPGLPYVAVFLGSVALIVCVVARRRRHGRRQ